MEEEEEETCSDTCSQRARSFYAQCVEEGGDPDDCGRSASDINERCNAQCADR